MYIISRSLSGGVYIGRSSSMRKCSPLANPFVLPKGASLLERETCVKDYLRYAVLVINNGYSPKEALFLCRTNWSKPPSFDIPSRESFTKEIERISELHKDLSSLYLVCYCLTNYSFTYDVSSPWYEQNFIWQCHGEVVASLACWHSLIGNICPID